MKPSIEESLIHIKESKDIVGNQYLEVCLEEIKNKDSIYKIDIIEAVKDVDIKLCKTMPSQLYSDTIDLVNRILLEAVKHQPDKYY